ncbi:MAG: hypothetical protein LBT04_04830 [Prevotellaceae bacterium]|jgi:hypothetical protein|nr:hypothetical protein [Prevotellaceae bacterium]
MNVILRLLGFFLLYGTVLCFSQETVRNVPSMSKSLGTYCLLTLNTKNGDLKISIKNNLVKIQQIDMELFFSNRLPNKNYLQQFRAIEKCLDDENQLPYYRSRFDDLIIKVHNTGYFSTSTIYPSVPKYKVINLTAP